MLWARSTSRRVALVCMMCWKMVSCGGPCTVTFGKSCAAGAELLSHIATFQEMDPRGLLAKRTGLWNARKKWVARKGLTNRNDWQVAVGEEAWPCQVMLSPPRSHRCMLSRSRVKDPRANPGWKDGMPSTLKYFLTGRTPATSAARDENRGVAADRDARGHRIAVELGVFCAAVAAARSFTPAHMLSCPRRARVRRPLQGRLPCAVTLLRPQLPTKIVAQLWPSARPCAPPPPISSPGTESNGTLKATRKREADRHGEADSPSSRRRPRAHAALHSRPFPPPPAPARFCDLCTPGSIIIDSFVQSSVNLRETTTVPSSRQPARLAFACGQRGDGTS